VELKDIQLPDSMQRAMARQAEGRAGRSAPKIINAEGRVAGRRPRWARPPTTMIGPPALALQLRNLQSLVEIGVDKNTPPWSSPAPLMSTHRPSSAPFLASEAGRRDPRPAPRQATRTRRPAAADRPPAETGRYGR